MMICMSPMVPARLLLAALAAFQAAAARADEPPARPPTAGGLLTARVMSHDGRLLAGAMASIVEVDAYPAKLGPGAGAPRAGRG